MVAQEFLAIGESFKARRKELNISLKEVETATSIRMNYLQAIEEGDVSKLISPIYAQGFMKQYANFLGLDAEQFVKDNMELFNKAGPQDFAYGIGTLEMRGNHTGKTKGMPNILWVLAFLLLLTLSYFIARSFNVI